MKCVLKTSVNTGNDFEGFISVNKYRMVQNCIFDYMKRDL